QPASLARKDKKADWNTPGVKAHDEWRHGSCRHERPRSIHIRDGLSESLAHVRTRMKCELEQPDVLNRFRFHALDARDVEKVIFVVVDEIAFHLRWGHSSIRLRDVNHRQIKIRKNVDRHPQKSKHRQETNRDYRYRHSQRAPKSYPNQPHLTGLP